MQPRSDQQDDRYKNADNDYRGPWISDQLTARNPYSEGLYSVICPSGRVIDGPPKGRFWAISRERFKQLDDENRIWWGKDGNNMPRLKRFLTDVQQGVVPQTIWLHEEVGHTQEAKKELLAHSVSVAEVFMTPKPERLILRVLEIATNRGDLVLDSFLGSFLGSGTTAAVAHKMGRRFIGIELGNHAVTHCVPRLRKVIDGTDPGGVTAQTSWKGGGGFRFMRLAPSLLERDHWGNWVVSREYNPAMLAEALCKLEGFRYEPNPTVFWQQGKSTEQDYLYVTTQTLDARQLDWLSEAVGIERSLLVLCRAYIGSADAWPNLTLKKIPNAVLGRCEFGKDDYSLRVAELRNAELPDASPTDASVTGNDNASASTTAVAPTKRTRAPRKNAAQTDLLSGGDANGDGGGGA